MGRWVTLVLNGRAGKRQLNNLGKIWRMNDTEEEEEEILLPSRKFPASAAGEGGGEGARTAVGTQGCL